MLKEPEIMVQKVISIGEVTYYSNQLIVFKFGDDITIDVPEVKELYEATVELTGGEVDLLSLVITGERNNITTQAFSFDMFKEMGIRQRTIAEAVIIRNLATRILANFYYKATKRAFPVKVFDAEREALEWLYTFKQTTL